MFFFFFTVFTLEIRIKEDWDEKLKDKTSEKFKKLSKLLKEEVWLNNRSKICNSK